MSHIEFEGKVYCDWRLSIYGCEGSSFFFSSLIFCGLVSGLGGLGMLANVFFRIHVLKDPLRSFLRGENLFHLSAFSIYLTHFILVVCLLAGVRFPATGILWTFLAASQLLAEGAFTSTATQALPDSLLSEKRGWAITHTTRGRFIGTYILFTSIIHVGILCAAYSLSESNPHASKVVERLGLTITAANAFLLIIANFFGPYLLKVRIQELLKEALTFKGEIDTTLLIVTNAKLNQVLVLTLWTNVVLIVNYLLLAYCPFYFTNMAMSKTIFLLTLPINFSTAIAYPIVTFYLDFKKWLHKEKGSSKGSKREDSSLQSQSQNHLQSQNQNQDRSSFAGGKDQVEMIIRDLTQKPSP